MKVLYWISDPFSERIGLAIVQVEPNEAADIEVMAGIVDGRTSGNFGVRAELIGEEPFDIAKHAKLRRANKFSMGQVGHPSMDQLKTKTRYYEVHVSRD